VAEPRVFPQLDQQRQRITALTTRLTPNLTQILKLEPQIPPISQILRRLETAYLLATSAIAGMSAASQTLKVTFSTSLETSTNSNSMPALRLPGTPIASRLPNASCASSFYDPKDI